MIDNPRDSTAGHVCVSKGFNILDGYEMTRLSEHDYQNAPGTDTDFMEAYAYDATPDIFQASLQHDCFRSNYNRVSKGLIGKVADLVIGGS
jgi:hypothetical protein